MSKLYTLLLLLLPVLSLAQERPPVPDYGKLLLIEERTFKQHFELGLEGGLALDNTTEDVYSIGVMANYVATPLFSFGLDIAHNSVNEKPYLQKLEDSGNVKVSTLTPDWFSQLTLRVNVIKGHLNLLNQWNSSFELSAVLGSGVGYNVEQSKTSSLISWGGELQIPFEEKYRAVLGLRHYKSYAFRKDELSFTSLIFGIRRSF